MTIPEQAIQDVEEGVIEVSNNNSKENKTVETLKTMSQDENSGEDEENEASSDNNDEKTSGDDGGEDDADDKDSDEDDDDDPCTRDRRERKLQHWEDSPFAVGLVNVTWKDDRTCAANPGTDSRMWLNAWICGCLGAGRVGNMAVLAQSTEEYDHHQINEETGETTTSRKKRPKLLCVMGPYWYINLCVTYPIILAISGFTCYRALPDTPIEMMLIWAICTLFLILSLAMIACRDPGILHRHAQRPPDDEEGEWRWNDQSRTYRPPDARFDPECQVVVEGFDHTCPWTGTAIGSRNMCWFRTFLTMIPICLALAVVMNVFF